MRIFSLVFLTAHLLFVPNANAWQVEKIKGTVTVLVPGSLSERLLREGDDLPSGSSIVSKEKSFALISFLNDDNGDDNGDEYRISIGPSSKIELRRAPSRSSTGLIGLLRGQMRVRTTEKMASAKREKLKGIKGIKGIRHKRYRLLLETRSAALGVRGTDFHVFYVPEARFSSVITYEGEVVFVKSDEKRKKIASSLRSRGEADNSGDLLETVLKLKDRVILGAGEYSGASEIFPSTFRPIRINEEQFKALNKNKLLDFPAPHASALSPVKPGEKDSASLIDPQRGIYAPGSDGFVHLDSGVYVAPMKSEGIGNLNRETGEYYLPKDIVLDPTKGFLLSEESQSLPESSKLDLLAIKDALNKAIAADQILALFSDEEVGGGRGRGAKLRRSNNIALGIGGMQEKLSYQNSSQGDFIAKDSSALTLDLLWHFPTLSDWWPYFHFTYQKIVFDQTLDERVDRSNLGSLENLYGILSGVEYIFSERIHFLIDLALKQRRFFTYDLALRRTAQTLAIPQARLGIDYCLFSSGRFSASLGLNAGLLFSRSSAGLEVASGLSLASKAGLELKLSEEFWAKLDFFIKNSSQDLNTSNFSAKTERKNLGALFYLGLSV